MIENASLIHEYQFVSMTALESAALDKFPDAIKYLAYPETIAMWNAVVKIRALQNSESNQKTDDALLLASLMVKDGYKQATPEFVRDKMLMVGRTWPTESMSATVNLLKELYERRSGDEYLETLKLQIKSGKISFEEAEELFSRKRSELGGVQKRDILEPESVSDYAKLISDERSAMTSEGVYRMPKSLIKLHNEVKVEMDTLVLITGATGSGKTIFTETWSESLMDAGEPVFYVMTELTKKQMIWRRLARKFKVPYTKLRLGYWEQEFSAELRPRANGGRIWYFEAGDCMLTDIINEARKRSAHLILDYWDMIGLGTIKALGGMKGLSMNKSDLVGYGLTTAKSYAQHDHRLVVVVQQLGKDEEAGPMDSARFRHRANLWLKIHTGMCEERLIRQHPFPNNDGSPRIVAYEKNKLDPLATIDIGKDSFGDSEGNRYPIFIDGATFSFIDASYVSLSNVTYGKV